MFLNTINNMVNIILPPLCPLCKNEVIVGKDDLLCAVCSSDLNYIAGQTCKTCHIQLLGDEEDKATCGECLTKKIHFEKNISLFNYDGSGSEIIKQYKYNKSHVLKKTLEEFYLEGLKKIDVRTNENFDLVMPVPLHKKRLVERGFNQALTPLYRGAKTLGLTVDYTSLARIRHTEKQAHLTAKQREKNIKGAFAVVDSGKVKGKNILLVDDVYTTGTTANECAKELKKHCSTVFVLTLARTMLS